MALAAGSILLKHVSSTTVEHVDVNKMYKGTLLIKHISVSPIELKEESSIADLMLRNGLRVMANELGLEVQFAKDLADPQ